MLSNIKEAESQHRAQSRAVKLQRVLQALPVNNRSMCCGDIQVWGGQAVRCEKHETKRGAQRKTALKTRPKGQRA